jgi:3-hydroxyisobutyrate dehydrogenase-like beta-hydroxyacid dehydrogenase
MERIGVIGVGHLGSQFVDDLLKDGYDVTVHDIDDERVQDAVDKGTEAANGPDDVVSRTDCTLLGLPGTPEVEAAMEAEDGILAALEDAAKHLIIDVATTLPETSVEYERKCHERGTRFIEAPITGGSPREGMHMMVGGTKDDYEAATDVLDTVCADHVRVGEIGKGTVLKLALQMRYAGHNAIDAEIVAFARDNGVDPELLNDFLELGVMDRYFTGDFSQEIEGLGGLAIWHKDIGYARQVARENDTALPLAGEVHEAYKATVRRADEDEGHASTLITYWQLLNDADR